MPALGSLLISFIPFMHQNFAESDLNLD